MSNMNKYQLAHPLHHTPTEQSVWVRPGAINAVKEVKVNSGDAPVVRIYLSTDESFYVVGDAEEIVDSLFFRQDLDMRADPEAEGVYEADEHGDDAEVYRIR